MIPPLTAAGLLPLGTHVATMAEVHEVFVVAAPYSSERARIFRALEIYTEMVWERLPIATLWLDGGFVTHKDWEPPSDVDVCILASLADVDASKSADGLALWTLLGVSAEQPRVDGLERLQPMSGLVDGFFVPQDIPAAVSYWRGYWQRLRGRDGAPDVLQAKGFLEVRADDQRVA